MEITISPSMGILFSLVTLLIAIHVLKKMTRRRYPAFLSEIEFIYTRDYNKALSFLRNNDMTIESTNNSDLVIQVYMPKWAGKWIQESSKNKSARVRICHT